MVFVVYTTDLLSYADYSPYGTLLGSRHGDDDTYRYGFQGQERDDEIKGAGNSYNYEYRMHDPRIGRFFATDPLEASYPWYTPYQFSGNKVIDHVELEGLEEAPVGKSYGSSTVYDIEDEKQFGFTGKLITNTNIGLTGTAADGVSDVNIPKGSNVLYVDVHPAKSKLYPDVSQELVYSIDYNSSTYTWNSDKKWYANDKGEEYPDKHWFKNAAAGIVFPALGFFMDNGFSKIKNNAAKANMSIGDYMVSQMASGIAETASDIWAGGHRRDIALTQLWMTTPGMAYEGLLVKPFDFFTFSANNGYGTKLSLFGMQFEFMYRNSSLKGGTLFSLKTANNSKFRVDYHSLPTLGYERKTLHYHTNFGGRTHGAIDLLVSKTLENQ